jgi:hypothetical protein
MDSTKIPKPSLDQRRWRLYLHNPRLTMTGWYVDRETGRNHLIYPSFMTHYWFRTIFPRFADFQIGGARGWAGFYLGLLRGKIRRNKWIFAAIVTIMGWYTARSRTSTS